MTCIIVQDPLHKTPTCKQPVPIQHQRSEYGYRVASFDRDYDGHAMDFLGAAGFSCLVE